MKKLINQVDDILTESLAGFALAHQDLVSVFFEPNFVTRKKLSTNKVAVISGGGSGHEPLHTGYVGLGMLDAACPGYVFTSPSPDQMLAAAEMVEASKGVLFIVKNYAGDVMNFEVAAEMLSCESATVLVSDDVAVENSTYTTGQRGVAGTVIVEKCVGALAETGASLADCKRLGDKVNSRMASMGVALSSCTVPAAGKPTFDLADNELEMGVGIHGEPGRARQKMREADLIVAEMVAALLKDLTAKQLCFLENNSQNSAQNNSENISENTSAIEEVLLLVNGFGATPQMELYLLFNSAAKLLQAAGITISRSLVGNYTTALDMAGASITICAIDAEIKTLRDAPVNTAALHW